MCGGVVICWMLPSLRNRAARRVAPIVVEHRNLLVKPRVRIRAVIAEAEHHPARMPHQIGAHRVASRVGTLEAGGEQHMRRRERPRGEHDVAGAKRHGLPTLTVPREHFRDSPSGSNQPRDHRVSLELEALTTKRLNHRHVRVVLGRIAQANVSH